MALAALNLRILDAGELVEGATVTIRRETPGKPLVQCFADRAGETPLGNPFVSADGKVLVFVASGAYEVTVSKGEFSDVYHYVGVGTASEADANQVVGLQWQFLPDAVIDSFVYRDAYDDEAANFSVLVTADETNLDAESNPLPTVYFKVSDQSADWSEPITWVPTIQAAGPASRGAAKLWTMTIIDTSDAAWPVPPDTLEMIIEGWGAGGSGGGGDTATSQRGSGAGAGGYFLKLYQGTMDATLDITIGAGGAPVNSASGGADGNDGGATVVTGSELGTLTAAGGNKGLKGISGGGLGGTATGGDINLTGEAGQTSWSGATLQAAFRGGTSPRGGRGGNQNVEAPGGFPGGGGACGNHTMSSPSGAGADGLVIIWTR